MMETLASGKSVDGTRAPRVDRAGPGASAPHAWRALVSAFALLAACAEPITPPEPVGDYTQWGEPIVVRGNAPGHSNSVRLIWANARATDPDQPFIHGYQEGSVIVKEIREDDNGEPGALRYVGIMRRIGPIDASPDDEAGWLFTESEVPQGDEVRPSFCWNRCHAAAPYNGAWYDYRR